MVLRPAICRSVFSVVVYVVSAPFLSVALNVSLLGWVLRKLQRQLQQNQGKNSSMCIIMCQIQQLFMEIIYGEIMVCLTGVGQNKIVEHFIHFKNILGAILKLITFFKPQWAEKKSVYFS